RDDAFARLAYDVTDEQNPHLWILGPCQSRIHPSGILVRTADKTDNADRLTAEHLICFLIRVIRCFPSISRVGLPWSRGLARNARVVQAKEAATGAVELDRLRHAHVGNRRQRVAAAGEC